MVGRLHRRLSDSVHTQDDQNTVKTIGVCLQNWRISDRFLAKPAHSYRELKHLAVRMLIWIGFSAWSPHGGRSAVLTRTRHSLVSLVVLKHQQFDCQFFGSSTGLFLLVSCSTFLSSKDTYIWLLMCVVAMMLSCPRLPSEFCIRPDYLASKCH